MASGCRPDRRHRYKSENTGGYLLTTPGQVVTSPAGRMLSTGFRPGYARRLWTTVNAEVAARRFMPPGGGGGTKPAPCGLRPVPCLHCSPIALWSSAPPSPVRTLSAALTSVALPLSFRVSAVRNLGSARLRCGLLVPLDHCVSSSGCHSGTAQAVSVIHLSKESVCRK